MDLVIDTNIRSDGRNQMDLNMLSLSGFWKNKDSTLRSITGIQKRKFEKLKSEASQELHDVASLAAAYLNGLRAGGRKTAARALIGYLDYQYKLGKTIGSEQGLEGFCLHLQSKIYARECGVEHAVTTLSLVNGFLVHNGKLIDRFHYKFSGRSITNFRSPYTVDEVSVIIKMMMLIFEVSAKQIEEHVIAYNNGIRHFALCEVSSIEKSGYNVDGNEIEVIFRNPAYWFMQSAFVLFIVFTWGNKAQVSSLTIPDIKVGDDFVETDYLYKGRARSFVRLNIGDSKIDGDRKGLSVFKRFFAIRNRLVSYYTSIGCSFSSNYLFFVCSEKSLEIRSFHLYSEGFVNHPLVATARRLGVDMPRVSPAKIRKTLEQITDSRLKNPLVILGKAQHNWDTYQRNYARGNSIESMLHVSEALGKMVSGATEILSFEERQKYAKDQGLRLIKDKEGVSINLNGLGCVRGESVTEQESSFIKSQSRLGRLVKICADYSSCIFCNKCAVIEDESALYNLLSFKFHIEYGKSIYIGSNKASQNYNVLLERLELALSFVDRKLLSVVERKINKEGASEVWDL
ncbi:hypothetical protein [Ferrimonas sp. YFM]|uniref:hypothetical protein n=1 Tax=Ferrimonas sp. YFM TaxID=3028878 RepID=UPI002572F574|nr:hypothetical protein [Ferrimonas sp. YFM]